MTPNQTVEIVWVAVGFLGQALFTARFLVQWIASEKRGESVVPLAFWWFSIGGGAILLSYAIYRRDPVFILGQTTGLLIYVRNLMLIHRKSGAAGDRRARGTDPEPRDDAEMAIELELAPAATARESANPAAALR